MNDLVGLAHSKLSEQKSYGVECSVGRAVVCGFTNSSSRLKPKIRGAITVQCFKIKSHKITVETKLEDSLREEPLPSGRLVALS